MAVTSLMKNPTRHVIHHFVGWKTANVSKAVAVITFTYQQS